MNDATKDRLLIQLATLGPVGHLPTMPGTWGSLVAAIAAYFVFLPMPLLLRPAVLLIILSVGVRACGKAETALGRKDPGCVVFDELFGMWVAVLPLAPGKPWWLVAAAFVFFRIFDILKPWPVSKLERDFDGGLGIMLDDGAAGIYAFLCLWALLNLLPLF